MQMKKTVIAASLLAVLGVSITTAASAASLVIDGKYNLDINATPIGTGTGGTFYKIKPGGVYSSSFTFGTTPNSNSNGMTNNSTNVTTTNDFTAFYGAADGGPGVHGSSNSADGVAGRLTFDVVNGVVQNATAFSIDAIFITAGGTFAQYMTAAGMSGIGGSIDASGNMAFKMGGRFGAINGPAGGVVGPWNIDPTNALVGFTTGTTSNPGPGAITGTACTGSSGNYACILASGGQVGPAWGTFNGNPYYEVWNMSMTRIGAATVSTVPVPAAAWLMGSGLVGLVGIGRRKKA